VNDSLSELANYVDDAFVLVPVHPYFPEQTVLGFYTFLPWVRTGIAQAVTAPLSGIRAGAHVSVAVQGGGRSVDVSQDLLVRGPGDVLSISPQQVIRRYPEDGHPRVEDSFLAHVEFDRPDFPWIFSPAAPTGDQLAPWVTLVVLRTSHATLFPAADDLPAHVQTTMSELQPLDDASVWAHAQVAGPPDAATAGASVADRLTDAYAAQNLSRVLCPRRLEPDESYLACLVPTYDAGVRAGLGATEEGTLGWAWHRQSGDDGTVIDLPVYLSWSFTTGAAGDFLSLAEKIVARPAPWQVGRRLLDTSRPGGGIDDLAPGSAGAVQTVLAPLFSPQTPDPHSPDLQERAAAVAEHAEWPEPVRERLIEIINEPDALAGGGADAPELPLLGPELYGRHQAARTRAAAGGTPDWFDQLNERPVDRVAAGLGTRVVQRDQEALMQSAWAQVGQVDAANASLRLAELARFVGESLHTRFLGVLGYGSLLQLTRAVHSRVAPGTDTTVARLVEASSVASSAVSSAFRRATRPGGPLQRYVDDASRPRLTGLLGEEGSPRDFRRPYAEPDGVQALADHAARVLPTDVVARHLDLAPDDPDAVASALVDRAAGLAGSPTLADAVTPQVVRDARPDPSFELRPEVSRLLVDAVTRVQGTGLSDPTAGLVHLRTLQSMGSVPTDVTQRVHDMSVVLDQHLPNLIELPQRSPSLNPVLEHRVVEPVLPGRLPGLQPFSRLTAPPAGAPRPVPPAAGTAAWSRAVDVTRAEIDLKPDSQLQVALHLAEVPATTLLPAVLPVAGDLVSATWPVTPDRPALAVVGSDLLAALHPAQALTARIRGRLGDLPSWLPADWFDDGRVRPVMAGPVFTRPMYQALNAMDPEWLIPGMARMPEPDLMTVLVINGRFVEGFLVGLSHEMGRELLWRGYPTDQAGTYFQRFFNAAADDLSTPIHRFTATDLGSHLVPTLDGRLVLVVRGELLQRFPDAMVLAMRADHREQSGHPAFSDVARDPASQAPVLFHGHLPPDTTLVGFDLTVDQVRAEDWWFVVAEHPTAPRFGLAEDRGVLALDRDSVSWQDLPLTGSGPRFLTGLQHVDVPDTPGPVTWGRDSATDAHLLLRNPVRAAWDARKLLGKAGAV